jgi:hypothetical protein
MTGCTRNPANDGVISTGLQSVIVSVDYVDNSNQPYDSESLPDLVYIQFPVIPGAIIGEVLTDAVFSTFALIGKNLTIDFDMVGPNIIPYATPMLATNYNSGLSITPLQTSILRVGTFAYSTQTGELLGLTGLGIIGSKDISQLILVYFDRPASLTGTSRVRGSIIEYDIDIDSAGFSLLKVEEIEANRKKISAYKARNLESITIRITSAPAIEI